MRYGIRQAPTLLLAGGAEPETLVGVGAVRRYLSSASVRA